MDVRVHRLDTRTAREVRQMMQDWVDPNTDGVLRFFRVNNDMLLARDAACTRPHDSTIKAYKKRFLEDGLLGFIQPFYILLVILV